MGMGLYTALVFGAIRPDGVLEGNEGEDWYDLLNPDGDAEPIRARSRYEADVDWFGYIVADGGYLLDEDDETPPKGTFDRTVLGLDILAEVKRRWPERLAACQATYERLRQRALALGVDLPEGRVLLVSDFE